ncbi:helicase-related protein, partial [Brucella melitensis]|uniref:helicase-related protein n=1 Tax=Brucella melitensis TaxID=29459 RepID=UPI0024952282
MIADKDRGFSWYRAITKANAKEVHIICSFHAKTMIIDLLGDSDVEVKEYERETPLQVETASFKLNDTRKGDAVGCVSRRGVLETASQMQKMGRETRMMYGSMPPGTRKKQMHRFSNGERSVIVGTDGSGMGLNRP